MGGGVGNKVGIYLTSFGIFGVLRYVVDANTGYFA